MHEAGHAVAAAWEGRQVGRIIVHRKRPGIGVVYHLRGCLRNPYDPTAGPGSARAAWEHTRARMLSDVRNKLAEPPCEPANAIAVGVDRIISHRQRDPQRPAGPVSRPSQHFDRPASSPRRQCETAMRLTFNPAIVSLGALQADCHHTSDSPNFDTVVDLLGRQPVAL